MKTLNIQEAKTHLSRYVDAVANEGVEVIIAKAGKPMAKLVPYKLAHGPRCLGRLAGSVPQEAADCWEPDEALNDLMNDAPLYAQTEPLKDRVAEEPEA